MGKTTLYHPVSLHVIRGAAEYCGFKFDKIHQLHGYPDSQVARYNITVESWPKNWEKLPLNEMERVLQGCFMDDMKVYWLRRNKKDRWMFHLLVEVAEQADQDAER